jgi:hypothetical protein
MFASFDTARVIKSHRGRIETGSSTRNTGHDYNAYGHSAQRRGHWANIRVIVKRCIKNVDNRPRNQELFSGVLDRL